MMQLRPSSSHRWTKCFAYPRFIYTLPPQLSGDAAREGTCAAWLAERVIKGEVQKCSDLLGESHENGWLIENDMVSYIQDYVDHIVSRGGKIDVERKVRLNEMIAGTPDAYAVLQDDVLYGDDLKFGFEIVDPFMNTQLIIYMGAIIRQFMKYERNIRKVVLGIYQPRPYHPDGVYRTWEITPEELMMHVREIEECGHACQMPNSLATPGPHCNHCEAAASCVALTHSVYKAFATIDDERQGHLTPLELSRELDFISRAEKLITSRKKALETEAIARMKSSQDIPTYGFEERYGNRVFTKPADIIKAVTGRDPASGKLCTPAELIRRGANKNTVYNMSQTPRIAPKLKKLSVDHYSKLFEK